MAKRYCTWFLTVLCFLVSVSFAQEAADSLVYAEGNIINAATKEPVKATITYQSLPYGNRVGSLNNTYFSFPMFDEEKYAITIQADGYLPAKYLLDPSEANEYNRVIKNIELAKGSPPERHVAGHVMRLNNLIFELGKSKISSESHSELELVEKMMKERPAMVIQLEGHTDYHGGIKENLKLSEERVKSVRAYLVERGIQKNRIKTKAFGGAMPLTRDDTPEGHRLNRRVELRILSN